MPKKKKKTTKKTTSNEAPRLMFKMNTKSFEAIWLDHVSEGKDWRAFCLMCFDHFTNSAHEDGAANVTTIKSIFGNYRHGSSTADFKYDFINDRAYQKCQTLKRAIEAAAKAKGMTDFTVSLPADADKRNGSPNTWSADVALDKFRKAQEGVKW